MIPLFEFDEAKSASNKDKHGIDFVEAQKLWDDDNMVVFSARTSMNEVRWAAIALMNEKNWTAFYTWREDTIRLFSVRRSRKNEEDFYYGR
jgi:uncharacterized protein